MNNDSAPGHDGLTVSFYKFFWPKLKNVLLYSFLNAWENNKLSISQRRGIITLLHKGNNLDRNNLGNWRPITLLNTDYKILSKLISLRLQPVLDNIINMNQRGFMRGRDISELIRQIDDSLFVARQQKLPGILASVDFRKAFDSVSKKTIVHALKLFNFGPKMIKLIYILINDSESCVRNGGWFSSFFPCERGVRQGCCTSPYLFLMVAELLAIKLRNSDQITGVVARNRDLPISKLLQYADDTTLFVKNEEELDSALNIIETFGSLSGLKLNRSKSIALPFGGYICHNNTSCNVKWLQPNNFIRIVGVWFSAEKEASCIDLNWQPHIESMVRSISNWKKRNLSIYGKIILCKTFVLSKINYIIQSLSLPETVLSEIDRLMFKFIWQKKISNKKPFERVSRSRLCQEVALGGLNMISVKDQQSLYCIKWIKRINSAKYESLQLIDYITEQVGGIKLLTKCRLQNPSIDLNSGICNVFWKNVINTWVKFHFHLCGQIEDDEELLHQPLFFNSNVEYRGGILFFPRWIKKGVIFVHHLFKNGSLLNREELAAKLDYPGFIFDFNALVNGLSPTWKDKLLNVKTDLVQKANFTSTYLTKFEVKIFSMKNQELRKLIMSLKNVKYCNENFWKRKLSLEVADYYTIAYNATKESRLRLLHFKILHNIYPTNILLNKMKVKPSALCDSCQVPDFIEHFFVKCDLICGFWEFISSFLKTTANIDIKLTTNVILLGITYSEAKPLKKSQVDYVNFIVLIGKLVISKFKYGKIKNVYLLFELETELRKKYLKINY